LAFTQPKIELVRCPHCGGDAEIWSDEVEGDCPECHRKFMRTHKPSCADWCKYARECLGEETYKKYQNAKSAVRKEALLCAAEDRFGWDEERKQSARARLRYAEEILKEQPASDPNIVVAAAVLSAEGRGGGKAGSSDKPADGSVEVEFRAILEELGYPNGFVKQVCGIVAGHPTDPPDNLNFHIVHDAILLADLGRDAGSDVVFLTETGRRIASERRHANGL
jgi:hypothetical protein